MRPPCWVNDELTDIIGSRCLSASSAVDAAAALCRSGKSNMKTAWTCCRSASANAPESSSGPRAVNENSCIFSGWAVARTSTHSRSDTGVLIPLQSTQTRVSFGTVSVRICKRLPVVAVLTTVSPVTFPPGWDVLLDTRVPMPLHPLGRPATFGSEAESNEISEYTML